MGRQRLGQRSVWLRRLRRCLNSHTAPGELQAVREAVRELARERGSPGARRRFGQREQPGAPTRVRSAACRAGLPGRPLDDATLAEIPGRPHQNTKVVQL